MNFWQAIGPQRRQILGWLLVAGLVFAVLPVVLDEQWVMAVYATVYGLYALGDGLLAVYQITTGSINGVVFIYRLWHAFAVMLILVLAFMLGGLATLISR
jgi:hypothetical protein